MQQATCAHSDATMGTSPGNHDDLSRRAIFAGMAGAAALLTVASVPAKAGQTYGDWERRLARHDASKRHVDDLWTRYKSMPASVRERIVGEEVERASEVHDEVWAELMKTPAPHLSALRWKLERLLEIEDDGMSASWCERLVLPVLADIARLLGEAA